MRRVSIVLWLLLACSVQAEVKLTGPNEPIETREPVDLVVEGIANDDLVHTRVVHWPRKGVRVRPILLWGGGNLLPTIEFDARNPGEYLVGVITPTADGLAYAEVVIQVKQNTSVKLSTNPVPVKPDKPSDLLSDLTDLPSFALDPLATSNPKLSTPKKPLLVDEMSKPEHQFKPEPRSDPKELQVNTYTRQRRRLIGRRR